MSQPIRRGLIEALKEYQQRHRMMFGKTPEGDLLEETVGFLEGLEETPAEEPQKKPRRTVKKETEE